MMMLSTRGGKGNHLRSVYDTWAMYGVLGTDGVVYGPITVAGLYEWIAQGRVVPGTVLIDGQGRQMMASSVPELQGAFPIQAQPYAAPGHYPSPAFQGPAKRKSVALLLAFLLGFAGAHRFYLGYTWSAVLMLVLNLLVFKVDLAFGVPLAIGTTIWLIVDMTAIGTGRLRPPNRQPLA